MNNCKCCGKESDIGNFQPDCEVVVTAKPLGLCYNCGFWTWKVNTIKESPNTFATVDGHLYHISPDDPKAIFKGFGGSEFIIKYFDGRSVKSHNLWHNGKIPDLFKDRIPNNAVFSKGID